MVYLVAIIAFIGKRALGEDDLVSLLLSFVPFNGLVRQEHRLEHDERLGHATHVRNYPAYLFRNGKI